MKLSILTCACLGLATAQAPAHAESFFRAELGLGYQTSADMGDGTWVQRGLPFTEKLAGTAFLAGVSAPVFERESFSSRVHAGYVYFGSMSATCECVPDANYNPRMHIADERGYIPFSGGGHTQGLALTLDLGYAFLGYRAAIEAGPWLYLATWHESHDDPVQPGATNLSHHTALQIGWTAGASIEHNAFGLHYRYYSARQLWNPNPGMVTGTHMLYASYSF